MAQLAPGGGVSFEDFFAAIAQQESGGNYNAVNPRTGASGKFQIMPGNIGPWSEQYLGKRVSVAQFRKSPALQEELARAVLQSYYNRYGARGAAAAWYSGDPNKASNYTKFRKNEPSIGEYVDQVMGRVGKAPTSSVPVSTTTVPQAPSTPEAIPSPLDAPTNPALGMPSGVDALAAPMFSSTGSMAQAQATSALSGQVASSTGATMPVYGSGSGSDPMRDRVIAEAMKYIGTPYVWGGTSPAGFDCSGLVQYVYNRVAGLNLPRISADQARSGTRVNLDQLRPGDLVASDNSSRNAGADHIAIWLGDGRILEAPKPGENVRVRNIGKNEGFYGVALNI